MAAIAPLDTVAFEPQRTLCEDCGEPVLIALVTPQRGRQRLIVAEPYEWEPRAACYVCVRVAKHRHKRTNCDRCGGTRYVGTPRPPGRLLAIDVAWSDEGHVRLLGPRTERRKGEACYRLHSCGVSGLTLA